MNFEDVVDHCDQLPLSRDFLLAAQTKSFEADGMGNIPKHRFHRAKSLTIDRSSSDAVDLVLHLFDQLLLPGSGTTLSSKRDLSRG